MSNELIRKRDEHGVRIAGAYSKKYCKDNEELGDMPDLSVILGVAIEQLNVRKAGRIPDYADDPQGIESFVSATQMYFEYITEANRQNDEKLIPDIEGWCLFIGVTKQTVLNYAKRNNTWKELIDYIKESILSAKKQLAFRFKIPPVVYLNDVANNHGYLNTNEFKITTSSDSGINAPTQTAQQIAAKHRTALELPEMEKPVL